MLLTPKEIARQAAQDAAAIGNAVPRWESELRDQIGAIATARRMIEAASGTGIIPGALEGLQERAGHYHDALMELLGAMEGGD